MRDAGRNPPGSSGQLPLPSAPVLDKYGLHAGECECARCALGYRPTSAERWNARATWERIEAARLKAKVKAAEQTTQEKHAATTWERLQETNRETAERLARVTAPVVRPATDEELDELKKLYGFRNTRRKGKP